MEEILLLHQNRLNLDHLGLSQTRKLAKMRVHPEQAFPYLEQKPDQFTRCLTEKLFIYALGRRISFTDRDDIDRIVSVMPKYRYGLRELIQQIVASEPFHLK